MGWIISNLGTIIVSILLIGAVVAIIVLLIKRKKQGKSSCSCGCSGCANAQYCHSELKNKTESEEKNDKTV